METLLSFLAAQKGRKKRDARSMFSRAKFLVSCPSSAASAVSLKKNTTSCCCSSPTPVRNISSSSSSTSMRVEGVVSTGEDLTNPSAFHNARSMDFRDWLSVERFVLAIVRDERKLSSFGIKDAEPDLPFNFSVEKTLENVRDVKKRSHQKQTERYVWYARASMFPLCTVSSASLVLDVLY